MPPLTATQCDEAAPSMDVPPLEESPAARYAREGYLCPVPVLTADETEATRDQILALAGADGGQLPPHFKHKLHLMFEWADRLVHHPRVLDAVEAILGPDVLCWTSNLLIKGPGHRSFVSWHQDASYWGLDPHEVVTAWIALTPSAVASGCVSVRPGSHGGPKLVHVDTYDRDNLLTRGQAIPEEMMTPETADLVLAPGEMSLHHIMLVHGSGPNRTEVPRIGFAIRYMSARVQKLGRPESAMVVRGSGHESTFVPETRPHGDFDLAGRVAHNRAVRRQVRNNFRPIGPTSTGGRARLALKGGLSVGGLDLLHAGLKVKALFSR
jgi:hypothetical protein